MNQPLADRVRPESLDDIVGQDRWLGPDAPLRRMVDEDRLKSLVLWGPPGCGKTTIARAIAHQSNALFLQISAVLGGVKELRGALQRAEVARTMEKRSTLLFVDEIHRWNKAQQDALLPHVESGGLVLIGATTENPSFELNAALRSRLQVIRLEPLATDSTKALLERALADENGLGSRSVTVPHDVLVALARGAAGDGRRALEDLERTVMAVEPGGTLTLELAQKVLARSDLRHDRDGEDHYNVLSALIKSLRGSDPQASIYWLARLIAGGEDPVSVARRLVVFASEDVGNADPRALQVAVATTDAVRLIGLPEARIPLAQCVTWLATCPKSNASYLAIDRALADVKAHGALPVPMHLRNAPTREMKDEGYGDGYRYPHDYPHRIVAQQYLPDVLVRARYYEPAPHGAEKTIADRLEWWAARLKELND